jgi:hypothetical protein
VLHEILYSEFFLAYLDAFFLEWETFQTKVVEEISTHNLCSDILHKISKRKANFIGHILRRNCLLRHVIEEEIKGGIEVAGRRGRRGRKLLDDLKERRGYSYLKEEALDRTMRRVRFGRRFGPVVRQTAK